METNVALWLLCLLCFVADWCVRYGGDFGVLRGFSQEPIVFTRANIRMGWRLVPRQVLFQGDVSANNDVDIPLGSLFWDPEEDEVTVLVEMAILPGFVFGLHFICLCRCQINVSTFCCGYCRRFIAGADRTVSHSVSFEHTFTAVGDAFALAQAQKVGSTGRKKTKKPQGRTSSFCYIYSCVLFSFLCRCSWRGRWIDHLAQTCNRHWGNIICICLLHCRWTGQSGCE